MDECDTCGNRRVRWHGCHSPKCTQDGCRTAVASARGKRVYERLGVLEAVPWAAVVLTLPDGPREHARTRQGRQELRKAAWRVVSSWIAWWCFHNDVAPNELGGVALFHPCGEDEDRWGPHLNFMVPLRALRPDGNTRNGRWKVPPLALHDLRARWAAVCRAHGFVGMHAVQVHYAPRVGQHQRVHAARYYGRGFPGWAAELSRPVYYGTLRCLRQLAGGEPERWPLQSKRCELCGGTWTTIAVEGPAGWIYNAGCGPPGG